MKEKILPRILLFILILSVSYVGIAFLTYWELKSYADAFLVSFLLLLPYLALLPSEILHRYCKKPYQKYVRLDIALLVLGFLLALGAFLFIVLYYHKVTYGSVYFSIGFLIYLPFRIRNMVKGYRKGKAKETENKEEQETIKER